MGTKSEWLAQSARIGGYLLVIGVVTAAATTALRAAPGRAPVADNCKPPKVEKFRVSDVPDGGSVVLSDGRRVLLAGIEAPRGPSPAQKSLYTLVFNQEILMEPRAEGATGAQKSQVFAKDGTWLQGRLVSDGLARVRTWPGSRSCAAALLRREADARARAKGLWADPQFAIRTPTTIADGVGTFQIVEGQVLNVANVRDRIFLNFGEDYRSDFTVHIKPEDVALFKASGLDLETLAGKKLRVRGFVGERNGPVITATAPEQIELLR